MRGKIIMLFVLGILLFSMMPNVNCEMHEKKMSSDLNSVLIVEVYYDTHLKDEPEEYVRIYNPTSEAVDIGNWSITDLEGSAVFPEGTILTSNSSFYITRNATAFYEEMHFKPDFAYYENIDDVPLMNREGNLRLANTSDEVILKDNQNNVVDVVVYGDSDYDGIGWDSNPANGVGEGTVLRRNTDEETGLYLDTNTSSDWDSLRMYKIGQSEFSYETFMFSGNVTCFVSPDSSYEAIINEIDSARESISISVYQFTSIHLAESLINASKRNITVKVFLEGLPAFWNMTNVNKTHYENNSYPYREAYAEKYIAKILYENETEVRFMIKDDKQNIHDRYRYIHSKFIVVDNSSVIISSENLKQAGIPADNTYGNRGWGVIIRNNETAKYFSDVFFDDWNPEMKDSFPFTPEHTKYGNPPEWFEFDKTIYTGNYEPVFSGITINGLFNVSPVLSPDTSLLETSSVIGMINSAKTSVYIEQLSCKINWNYYSNVCDNLYLNAAIDAARRGCDVKILMDSRYTDFDKDNLDDNYNTVLYINKLATKMKENGKLEGHLEARLAYLDGLTKVHNKGVIVDSSKVLVSSISWDYNSVFNNREAGVIIENQNAAEYYEQVFYRDWNVSHNVSNPTPPNITERSILITEVYYDTYLQYEPEEYLCIHNPTTDSVDISGWQITDQDSDYKGYEGTILFPEGTILYGGQSLYITRNATAFYEEMRFMPDFEYMVDSHIDVKQMEIIDSSAHVDQRGPRFGNAGDEIILTDDYYHFDEQYNHIIDVVVYGNSSYVYEHPNRGWYGKTVDNVSQGVILKRNINETTGQYVDTNTSSDWESPHIYRPGQSHFPYQSFTFTGNVTAFVSPDCSYETLVSEIDTAKFSMYINLYQFSSPFLMEHVINVSNRGVDVKVFLEGGPVGGFTDAGKYIAQQLHDNGCEVRYMITNDTQDIHDRYRFNHAKYVVIDNATVMVMSENWGNTGIPKDSSYGNRGWGIIVRNKDVANYFATIFFDDWDPNSKDSYAYNSSHPIYGAPLDDFEMNYDIPSGNYAPQFNSSTFYGEFTVSPVLSPDTSLLETSSVIGMINSAEKNVYIEQLSCKINWNYYSTVCDNLYLNAAIDAARRGCDVKILLDSRYIDPDDNKTDNLDTVTYINKIAEKENLSLEARLVYLKNLSKIHNKGVIVDCNKTLISSINWGYNSVINNREAGVIIENRDVAEYFTNAFFYDWNAGNEADNDNEDASPDDADNEKAGWSPSSWQIMFLVIIIILIISVIRDIYKRRRR